MLKDVARDWSAKMCRNKVRYYVYRQGIMAWNMCITSLNLFIIIIMGLCMLHCYMPLSPIYSYTYSYIYTPPYSNSFWQFNPYILQHFKYVLGARKWELVNLLTCTLVEDHILHIPSYYDEESCSSTSSLAADLAVVTGQAKGRFICCMVWVVKFRLWHDDSGIERTLFFFIIVIPYTYSLRNGFIITIPSKGISASTRTAGKSNICVWICIAMSGSANGLLWQQYLAKYQIIS